MHTKSSVRGTVRVGVGVRVRVQVRVRVGVGVRVGVPVRVSGGGILPTTSHSVFYGRVGPIVIFSHWQP